MHSHSHAHGHSHDHGGGSCCHGDHDEDEARLEREALGKVVLAFRRYEADANRDVDRWELQISRLPPHQQALLASQKQKFATARQCIYNNMFFLKSMLAAATDEEAGGPSMLVGADAAADDVAQHPPLAGDTEKVRYVLKNLVRDWSKEGEWEREASYGRIVNKLRDLFKDWDPKSPERPRVLLPGTGLARLCCEVAGAGFEAQGNEFAYFMLITGAFILNQLGERDMYTIFPWVTSTCNVRQDCDQLRGVTIPDVCPLEIVSRCGIPGLLSMSAGDFVEVYSDPDQAGQWDAVATCFFIDTAHNIVQYLEVLAHCIKPGGYWINLGPLLYHWADGYGTSELSIELSLEEIRRIAGTLGFTLVHEEEVMAPYIANIRSMYQTEYHASFWTMKKTSQPPLPLAPQSAHPPAQDPPPQPPQTTGQASSQPMPPPSAPQPSSSQATQPSSQGASAPVDAPQPASLLTQSATPAGLPPVEAPQPTSKALQPPQAPLLPLSLRPLRRSRLVQGPCWQAAVMRQRRLSRQLTLLLLLLWQGVGWMMFQRMHSNHSRFRSAHHQTCCDRMASSLGLTLQR